MMTAGIICGLFAALFQSLAYLATRHFVQRRPSGASRRLLVLASVWMGVFSLVVLPLAWPAGGIPLQQVLQPAVLCALFYICGQAGLLMALRYTEPSRVSALLGFKIVILALLTTWVRPPVSATGAAQGLTALQWMAVALCCGAAVWLNYAGAALRRRAVLAVLIACVSYSLTDWYIAVLVGAVRAAAHTSFAHASVIATCLAYMVSGAAALAFLPFEPRARWRDWRGALPFAVSWYVGMFFLFAAFGFVGMIFGNILQSTRGLLSVMIAPLLMHLGLVHLEPRSPRRLIFRRIAAATLMFLAITLYMKGKPVDTMKEASTPAQGQKP